MKLADRLFGFFPQSAASDPEIFMTGVVGLFSGYPRYAVEATLSVTTGLPSRHKFLPSIAEIREALEAEHRTFRYAAEWNKLAADTQLQIAGPVTPKPSIDEMKAKYGADWGLHPIDEKQKSAVLNLDQIAGKYGVSREQLNSIPNAPIRKIGTMEQVRAPAIRNPRIPPIE